MSSQEKTEEPTPTKLRKAREKGEVAKSRDLISAAVVAAGIGVIAWKSSSIGADLETIMLKAFEGAVHPELDGPTVLAIAQQLAAEAAAMIAPILVALAVAAGAATFLQIGPMLVIDPLKPKLDRLNAVSGLKRMFFSLESWVELIKATIKTLIVAVIAWTVVQSELAVIMRLSVLPLETSIGIGLGIIGRCILYTVLIFVLIASIDLLYQRWQFRRKNRMTKNEVREEFKSQEGDPQHKAERKRLHEEISSSMMIAQVEKADIVVTNPTHIACALRYDPRKEDSPRLVAKGRGAIAERIREIAREMDIPIVRDISLAKALHELELDTQIPEELYDAAAELLKWVEMVAASRGELPTWLSPEAQAAPEDEAV